MRIKELKIYASNFVQQVDFYSNIIGLKMIEQTRFEAQFQIGKSILILSKQGKFSPYHFAINIPSNKIKEALSWLEARVVLLKDGQNKIQEFESWNAKAIYFYDKDKNIVELIARKNLGHNNLSPFGIASWLEISEIGVAVNDIKTTYEAIKNIVDLKVYDGGFERFCAIGDEKGLFICINKQVKDWFPTDDKAYSSEFIIKFEEYGSEYVLEFKNKKMHVVS